MNQSALNEEKRVNGLLFDQRVIRCNAAQMKNTRNKARLVKYCDSEEANLLNSSPITGLILLSQSPLFKSRDGRSKCFLKVANKAKH